MATSMESVSPSFFKEGSPSFMGSSSPIFSPSSDKRFWSNLRSRVDSLLENRKPSDKSLPLEMEDEAMKRQKRLKEDSMLLLRGFDSVAQSLSHLSHNLENALQGAKDLAKPPTLTEVLEATLEKAKSEEDKSNYENKDEEEKAKESEENNRGLKRKLDSPECPQNQTEDSQKENGQSPKELGQLKKAKNLAISMATKAAGLARELRSVKSDVRFMQERCNLLEEENRKLRHGFGEDIQPEEDDLVRLQLEALLAEKSRLANENANLKRENQCLNQLVEYHQLTSQDLSASYENLIKGMCLDFSSPADEDDTNGDYTEHAQTPRTDILGVSKSLDECYDEEQD
ncbi:hypothetical protein Adt_30622 [Abeliophyllum distichum]|uniref:Uncharacterized protein n=1 Tax=Abeliophyllum distichum TaxID=126358 RepID=A0ABD1RCM8_9LAMI